MLFLQLLSTVIMWICTLVLLYCTLIYCLLNCIWIYLLHSSCSKSKLDKIKYACTWTHSSQVWGQIHWNVFKYEYFSFGQIHSFVNVFKYKYFWMYFFKLKNKFIVFPFLFILIYTLPNITASTRFVTSIFQFFVDYTWEVQNSHQSDEERWDLLIWVTHKMFHIILWSISYNYTTYNWG